MTVLIDEDIQDNNLKIQPPFGINCFLDKHNPNFRFSILVLFTRYFKTNEKAIHEGRLQVVIDSCYQHTHKPL